MSQNEIWWNLRSLPTRSNISWFATENWLDRREVHRDGQISTGRPLPLSRRLWSSRDIGNIGISHRTNQAVMHRWNSDQTSEKYLQIYTVSTVNLEKSDLNRFLFINSKGGIRRLLHPVPHGGSGMNTGGAHFFKKCCSKIVYSWWQSAATDGVCKTIHRHTSHYSTHFNVARGIGSSVLRARHPCIIRMVFLSWYSSILHSALFTVSPIFLFILLISTFIFHVGRFGEKYTVRFREWGVRHFGRQQSSHRLWAQNLRRLPHLRDHWNLHPGVLQRQQALELAWLGDRWLHHRQSALFTTVHSGARGSSEP